MANVAPLNDTNGHSSTQTYSGSRTDSGFKVILLYNCDSLIIMDICTLSLNQKMHQLLNGIAQNYKDRLQ